jgi:TPR repeat protein
VKSDRGEAYGNGSPDIERQLKQLDPRPVPPGLCERMLGSATEAGKNTALSPRMRVAAVALTILLVAALGINLFIGGQEKARLAILLEGPALSVPAGPEASLIWTELAADLGDIDRCRRVGLALSRSRGRGDPRKALLEARDRLKGMIEHEDPENIL